MTRAIPLLLAAALALAVAAAPPAARAQGDAAPAADDALEPDPFDELSFDEGLEDDDVGDPLETVNRGIFWVNDGLDRYAIDPISTAWDRALPDPVQRSLRNAFDNLRFPINFVNHLFQLKPLAAGEDLGRFLLNTTVGLGGFLDPAVTIGWKKQNEDFGQTLGYWGVPPGPYLMIPVLGPANVRDTGGFIVDSGVQAVGFFIPFWVSITMQSVDVVNRRSLVRRQITAEREAALDWYAAVRSAYSQYRENLVKDRRSAAETGSALFSEGAEDAEDKVTP